MAAGLHWVAMKTNLIANPPALHDSHMKPAIPPRLSVITGFLMAVFCAALVSFIASPVALAGGADGEYMFTSATGTITANGETQELPQDLIQQFTATQTGGIVIKNNKLSLDRAALVKLIKKLTKEYGAEVDYKISGPTSIKFTKHGKAFTASTSKPVAVTFAISHPKLDQTIKGSLKSDFDARVKGRILTLKVPVSGKLMGKKVSAEMTIVCTR